MNFPEKQKLEWDVTFQINVSQMKCHFPYIHIYAYNFILKGMPNMG